MGIIYQTSKKTGIRYAYDNKAYWDKEKKQSRAVRKLIGKVDPETGEIVPTRSYKKRSDKTQVITVKLGPVPITKVKRSFYGATYLFDQIGELTQPPYPVIQMYSSKSKKEKTKSMTGCLKSIWHFYSEKNLDFPFTIESYRAI
jgi:hypothetical protein